MSWQPPVPSSACEGSGQQTHVVRAWPDKSAGDYILEIATPGRQGVRAGLFRQGNLQTLEPDADLRLPALATAALHGDVVVHRAGKRAVVRKAGHAGDGQYIKVFRPNHTADAADRHLTLSRYLSGGGFLTPTLLSSNGGALTFTAVPGKSLFAWGQDPSLTDRQFGCLWEQWSAAWIGQYSGWLRTSSTGLPNRPAAVELENLRRIADLWLLHSCGIPAASRQRKALAQRLDQVAAVLLAGEPDPPRWSHGDLHDKQILAVAPGAPLGLIDFDEASEAEPALDLANLSVHLELRLQQGRLTAQRFNSARRQVAAAAEGLQVTPARFQAYAAATRLRLGCLYAFRPPWAHLAGLFMTGRSMAGTTRPDGLRRPLPDASPSGQERS